MQHFFSLGVRIVASSLLFFVCTAHAYREIIVAADGSGDFMTIQASVDAVPDHDDQLHLIRIQPGVYREVVRVSSDKGPIRFVGSDAATTVLTYNNDATTLDESGKAIGTSRSASVFIDSNDFSAEAGKIRCY